MRERGRWVRGEGKKGLGWLRLSVATWDQEVTLRMEVMCQEREAGRQRKSEGVPHD